MCTTVDSVKILQRYGRTWHLLGLQIVNRHWLLKIYDYTITVFVTICFPLHLIIGLFQLQSRGEIFFNLIVIVACLMCSVKQFLFRVNFEEISEINELLRKLDKHVVSHEDGQYHRRNVKVPTEFMLKLFIFIYNCAGVSSILLYILKTQPDLVYSAWLPFDWRGSWRLHFVAVSYQFIGMFITILQNIANDAYAPMELCILAGHIKLLGMRVSRIGYDQHKTEAAHYEELVLAVEDYKCLMSVFYKLQATISWNILLQSVTSGINFCVCIIYLMFYAKEIFQYGFALGMSVGISIEFYPCCYYGSVVEQNFHDLTFEIFSCNWLERNVKFQRSLRIFGEISLRRITPYAKNMVKIHLDTYFNTMKASYSLFCLIMNFK